MNYHKIEKWSISNGHGVRVVLWCSGCTIHCDKCQNPQTWDFNSGSLFDGRAKQELFDALSQPYIKGLTLSGGHPLEPQNITTVYELIKELKEKFPDKDIWLYTGYTLEEIYQREINYILPYIDVIVDGRFIPKLRDLTLWFKGSSNQRIIDVKKTLAQNKIVLYEI